MNTAVHFEQQKFITAMNVDPIVIVGTGPVGVKALMRLLEINPQEMIVIYGDEPWEPYNRVKLSSFLAGDVNWHGLVSTQIIPNLANLVQHHNCKIVSIDRENKLVIDELGREQKYRKLILALGSTPHVPAVEGTDLKGMFTFRNLTDAQHLIARQVRSRTVVVVGGGVLGLEAAKAMLKNKTKVIVIDHAIHLMANQLDEDAAELVREHILSLGIILYLGSGIKQIIGETEVKAIELRNGHKIECDTVIFSTGIKPNIELARQSKLAIGRGIRVSDKMQTSDPDIYAVGECAEHRDIVYGLVAPGYEQAKVAAADINNKKSKYTGSITSTQLKVVGISVFSMGRTGAGESRLIFKEYVYSRPAQGIYRKLIIFKNRLVGCISVGDWGAINRIQENITKQRFIWPWQKQRFLNTGDLWPEGEYKTVSQWPSGAIVCNCMNVSRGQCSKAIHAGCTSVEQVMEKTSASTVCGGCRPLLQELLGGVAKAEKIKALKSFMLFSLIAIVLTMIALLSPGVGYNMTFVSEFQWDSIWRDSQIKQITGFSVLGLTLLGLLLSLKKRWRKFKILPFSTWRYIHLVVGLFILLALFLHTGFRLGNNLNAWLMSLFAGLMLVGGFYGLFMSLRHKFDGSFAQRIRAYLNWSHLLLFWPVPVLLGFHILKTYYF